MLAAGMPAFPAGHPKLNAGRILRYGAKKKAWYRLYEIRAKSGAFVVGGDFGVWGEVESSKISIDWRGVNAGEREMLMQARVDREAAERDKLAARAKFAATRARVQWDEASPREPVNADTYLRRKGTPPERGLRFMADGALLVPMIRYDVTEAQSRDFDYAGPPRLVGLQKIEASGKKRFNTGVAMAGAATRLGGVPGRGELILITEGVATALSLRMACAQKYAVFVAFSAGNLLPVAKILRALYPASPILFCADDDAYLAASMNRILRDNHGIMDAVKPPATALRVRAISGDVQVSADWVDDAYGVPGIVGAVILGERVLPFARENAGRVYAHRAAAEVGNAWVVIPLFAGRELPIDPVALDAPGAKLTDFNDLHAKEGLPALAAQLAAELERGEVARQVQAAVRAELSRAKKTAKDKAPPVRPAADFDWGEFYQRFTLIYPTDTVYDARLEVIAKLSAIKIAFGDRQVKWWLESADRRTVNVDQVVFDPAGRHDAAAVVNLFRGLPKPATKPGARCERLLGLLQYLCGEADQDVAPVTDWVLNWLAYPLQHLGAKMATSVVMHGPAEGTGKNLFFNAVRDIYGRYASLITQTQLESPYNGWMSQRLFVIANEVISRSELRHHVGRLKNLVTESPLPIEEKYLPMRYEDNHMNMVFLTNEFQALQISPSDRRYMVIRTPAVNTQDFYQAIVDELAAGGVGALRDFLLAHDLGDFNEHSKTLLTAAKADLIEMGLSSPQQFWTELHAGLIVGVEYCPALWSDLYGVYEIWAKRNGVRNPRQSNIFAQEFTSMNGVKRLTMRIADPDKTAQWDLPVSRLPQRAVYRMGECPAGVAESDWVWAGVKKFRSGAREYLRDGGFRRSADNGDYGG